MGLPLMISKITEYTVYKDQNGDEVVYCRNSDGDAWAFPAPTMHSKLTDLQEKVLWNRILRASKNNIALKNAVEHCIMVYKLSISQES